MTLWPNGLRLLRWLSLALFVALATAPLELPRAFAADSPRRPNVVLFIADDMTYLDCGAYGNRDVKTPHIDKLAAGGMKFNLAFTATAMCAPTRQQLYTGVFPVRNGAFPNHSQVYEGTKSVVHYLKELGYRVGLAGKNHCGPRASFPWENIGGKGKLDFDAIAGFINRDKTQPYCLIVASKQPHTPWNQGNAQAYPPEKLSVPPYLVDTPATRQGLSRYYAEITFLDGQVGRCQQLVRQSGAEDNTLFIFTSEQGSSFPFAKWTCYDNGLRTAFIARWPARVKAGSQTDAMIQYVDVVPTLLEAAGGKAPEGLDGRSFLAVLLGRAGVLRDYVFGAHTTRGIINGTPSYPIRSIRSRRYKLILNLNHQAEFTNAITRPGGVLRSWSQAGADDPAAAARAEAYQKRPAEEFYDLSSDPYELHNLADNPTDAEIRDDLRKRLRAWMRQQNDQGMATEMQAKTRQGRGGKAKKPKRQGG